MKGYQNSTNFTPDHLWPELLWQGITYEALLAL